VSPQRLDRWPRPILALVVGADTGRRPLEEVVSAAFAAGVDWLQLRDRRLESDAFVAWARPLIAAAQTAAGKRPTAVIINRRADLAKVLAADGVHLGFDGVGSEDAREFLGNAALVGVSTHYKDEIDASHHRGADYVHFAPIFEPLSKPSDREPVGLEGLTVACRRDLPVIAQGGIAVSNATSVVAAGARGIAITGAIVEAADPGAVTEELRAALDAA